MNIKIGQNTFKTSTNKFLFPVGQSILRTDDDNGLNVYSESVKTLPYIIKYICFYCSSLIRNIIPSPH